MLPDAAPSQARPGRPGHPGPAGRAAALRRPRFADAAAGLAGVGLAAVVAAVLTSQSRGSLAAPGGLLTALGQLAALAGTYLLLIMVVLVARLPWLERAIGQDKLIGWHRRVAPWAIGLICLHVVATSIGYTQAARTGLVHELWVLTDSYRDILTAVVGFGLMVLVGIFSYRAIRRRLRYETWWALHLYLYLGLALAFAHQIVDGLSFIGHPLTRALWIAVWIATAGMVLACRIGLPAWRSLRHQLRVVEVRDEGPDVISVICQGRNLDRLAFSGGQFFQWRFLTRGLWWQAHPFSLSAMPQPPYLRITMTATGDASRQFAALPPGTRVAIEGPYGSFTRQALSAGGGVLLVAAGAGITPLRALLEDLPAGTDVVVVTRASRPAGLLHRDEITALVRRHRGKLHELVGPRKRVTLTPHALRKLAPDITGRDVYICGPEGFGGQIVAAARELGVPERQIHIESFQF